MAIIYLIDDDQIILDVTSMILQKEGYEIIARDSIKGLREILEKGVPDLLILDLLLPDGDGIEELQRLREVKKTRFMPIIMLSATVVKKKIVTALESGADDYITKPVEPVELVARVRSALKIGELRRHRIVGDRLEAVRKVAKTVSNELREPLRFTEDYLNQLRDEPCRLGGEGIVEKILSADDEIKKIKDILEEFQKVV